jgi:glycosyltransferase involved in cell wall biosynthesis
MRSGGAERVASRLCSEWSKREDVTLATGDQLNNDYYSVDKNVKRLSLNFSYSIKSPLRVLYEQVYRFWKILSLYNEVRPDVVILSCSDMAIRCIFSLLLIKKPIIVCEHNNYHALKSKFKRLCRLVFYRKATHLLLLTNRDVRHYTERNFPGSKITVMPNPLGIENDELIHRQTSASLLAVGSLCEQKAFTRLIDLFVDIDSKCNLIIVGEGPDRNDLECRIIKLGLSNRIKLVGQVDNISYYYRTSSILLMTSIYEGLPMVIGEANAFGLPVISYDCPTGPGEMIEDGFNGFLIKDGDASAFAACVNSLVNDFEQYTQMSNNSFFSAKKMSISKIDKQWEKLK